MPGPQRISWHDLNKNGLPKETTAVVNLAGQNVLDMKQRWNDGFKQNVWNSRINTTSSLTKAILNANITPKAFILLTGVGAYKPSNSEEYNEESILNVFDFFSKLCMEWEKCAKIPTNVSCRQVSIRSGVVLGKDGGMIKQLYLPFKLGLGGPVSPGNQYLPWIHIDDLIRLILYALEHNHVRGVLNGVAPHTISNEHFSSVRISLILTVKPFANYLTNILGLCEGNETSIINTSTIICVKRTSRTRESFHVDHRSKSYTQENFRFRFHLSLSKD